MKLLTTIPQSIVLTITPRGHPLKVSFIWKKIQFSNKTCTFRGCLLRVMIIMEIDDLLFSPSIYKLIVEQTRFFSLDKATRAREGKLWIQTSFTPLKKLTLCHILLEGQGLGKYMQEKLFIMKLTQSSE